MRKDLRKDIKYRVINIFRAVLDNKHLLRDIFYQKRHEKRYEPDKIYLFYDWMHRESPGQNPGQNPGQQECNYPHDSGLTICLSPELKVWNTIRGIERELFGGSG
jgi:hypothetical protein